MTLRMGIRYALLCLLITALSLSEAGSMVKEGKQGEMWSKKESITQFEHVDNVKPCQIIHDQNGEGVALLLSLTDAEESREYTVSFVRRSRTATYRGKHGNVATEWSRFNSIRFQLSLSKKEGDLSLIGSDGQILISGYIPKECWETLKRYIGNEIPIVESMN